MAPRDAARSGVAWRGAAGGRKFDNLVSPERGLAAVARHPLNHTQLGVARAIAGVRQAGLEVAEVTIAPDGSIKIVTTTDNVAEPPDPPSDNDDRAKARFREKLKGV